MLLHVMLIISLSVHDKRALGLYKELVGPCGEILLYELCSVYIQEECLHNTNLYSTLLKRHHPKL